MSFQVVDGERSGGIDERLLGPRELLRRFLAGQREEGDRRR
jgi:hypothetical protein